MSFTQKDRVELEELMQDFSRPVSSAVMPRWERKALQTASSSTGMSSGVDCDLTSTGMKRSCPGTPASSPSKRMRTVRSTPSKTPSNKVCSHASTSTPPTPELKAHLVRACVFCFSFGQVGFSSFGGV